MAGTVTALDVGHDSLKVATLRLRDGLPELVQVASEPLEELGRLEDGPEKSAALRARVRKLFRSRGIPSREVVVGISGRTTMMRYIQVPPVPPWRLEALMKFEAEEQSGLRSAELGGTGRSAYDHRTLDVPDVDGQSTVMLALSQESTVEERTGLAAAAGAADADLELPSIGLFNAYVFGHGADEIEDRTTLLLDIGATEINLVITRNGGLFFARHQPGGGRRFTQAIREALDLPWPQAEEYKLGGRARIYADPAEAPSEEARAVSEALSREAAEIAARTVEASLYYCRSQTKMRELGLDCIQLSGGGSALPGLAEFFGRRLRTEVAMLEPFRKISFGAMPSEAVEGIEGNMSALAVPLGLALSRLEPNAVRLDLRTHKAKEQRKFRRRGAYLWAAASVFALGMVFWIAGAVRNRGLLAEAREIAEDRSREDRTALGAFNAARQRHSELSAQFEALQERVTSGEDLLRALSQLKKRTPKTIRLVELSTIRPKVLGDSEDAPDRAPTFQAERLIYLRGYARSSQSHADATLDVNSYQKTLAEAKDLFEEIKQVFLDKTDTGDIGGLDVVEFVLAIRIARLE